MFFVAVDIIKNNFKKIDKNFFFNSLYYLPSLIPAFIIALNPLTAEEHSLMGNFLSTKQGIGMSKNTYL